MTLEADRTEWSLWWEFNRHRFLRLRERVFTAPVQTSSDEFFLGATRRIPATDTLQATAADRLVVVPALHEAMTQHPQRDVVSACLVALAKIGLDHKDHALLPVLRSHLHSHDQEIRETAAVCLGIARSAAALDDLLGLVGDDAHGRALCSRSSVDERTRAFAAYGLGVLARHNERGLRTRAAAGLLQPLQQPDRHSRNLKVAAIHALSLTGSGGASTDRLREQILVELERYYVQQLGVAEQLIQAHVPTAVGRLLGRTGPEYLRRRWYDLLEADLAAPASRRNPALAQSAALALGELAPPDQGDGAPDDQGFRCGAMLSRTQREHRDVLTRHFCLMAMAQAGGDGNRTRLLHVLANANQVQQRAWAALALGVLARLQLESAGTAAPDLGLGALLADALASERNPEVTGALAVALGLCRHRPSAVDLQALLDKHSHQDELAGQIAIGLALLGDRSVLPQLEGLLAASIRRPVLLRQLAAALGVLGDREVAPRLIELLAAGDPNVARTAAIAAALGQIGDRRTIDPLCTLLRDKQISSLARAFAAVALGDVTDHRLLPWNEPYARNANYYATVETLIDGRLGILDIL